MNTQKPFRFGITDSIANSNKEWLNKVCRAEELGYHSFLVADHFGAGLAPLPALMAAAKATSTLRIGSCVLNNDYRHPAVLAKEVATLDVLSNGRFELGLGAGWHREEYKQAGIAFEKPSIRISRLNETLQIIKKLFGNEPTTFQGSHYTITNLNGLPKPIQKPHPPIMVGGAGQKMLSLAAREANIISFATKVRSDGSFDFVDSTSLAIAKKVDWVRKIAGPQFDTLELHINVGGVIITDNRQHTATEVAPTVGLTRSQLLDCLQALIGTPEEIAEDLLKRREQFGISYISIDGNSMETFAPIIAKLVGK